MVMRMMMMIEKNEWMNEWNGREFSLLFKNSFAFMQYLKKKWQDLLGNALHFLTLTAPKHGEYAD